MGLNNSFYIVKEKIRNGFVAVKNALTHFFERALNFLKTVTEKLEQSAQKYIRGVLMGATHFFRRVADQNNRTAYKYQEGTKQYSLEEEIGEWNEMTITRDIEMENVPPQYRTMEGEFEEDDTVELDNALEC